MFGQESGKVVLVIILVAQSKNRLVHSGSLVGFPFAFIHRRIYHSIKRFERFVIGLVISLLLYPADDGFFAFVGALVFGKALFQIGFLFVERADGFFIHQLDDVPAVRGEHGFGNLAGVGNAADAVDKGRHHAVGAKPRELATIFGGAFVVGKLFYHLIPAGACLQGFINGIGACRQDYRIGSGGIVGHLQEKMCNLHAAQRRADTL